MKTYVVGEVQFHAFLTLVLDGENSVSGLSRFTPGQRFPGTQKVGGRVSPKSCSGLVENREIYCLDSSVVKPAAISTELSTNPEVVR
jgi:hypothetical protein